jgi:hypothetical protein
MNRSSYIRLAAAFVALCALASTASSAAARGRLRGIVPRAAQPLRFATAAPAPASPLTWHGGPVMHSTTAYAIFWDPGSGFSSAYRSVITRFLADVAHDSGTPGNPYSVAGQYTDASGNAAYRASFVASPLDTTPYPASGCPLQAPATVCLTDTQIQREIAAYIAANHLPTGLAAIYFLLTPNGVLTCQDAGGTTCSSNVYCGYHGDFAGPTIYAQIPYAAVKGCDSGARPNASDADPATNIISHEHIEAMTDPLGAPGAWYDANGDEIADKCNSQFGPPGVQYNQTINGAHYFLQWEFSNGSLACEPHDQPPVASFTISGSGPDVSFDGRASTDPDGTVQSYLWDFGDGTSASGSTARHSYATPGAYTVTLTVTDDAGSRASALQPLSIAARAAPPAPTPSPPPAPTVSPPEAPMVSAPVAPSALPAASAPPPTAQPPAAAVPGPPPPLRASLASVARVAGGLLVALDVDRASRADVQVLVGRRVARRLGIRARADRSGLIAIAHTRFSVARAGRASHRVALPRRLRGIRGLRVRVTLTDAAGGSRVLNG